MSKGFRRQKERFIYMVYLTVYKMNKELWQAIKNDALLVLLIGLVIVGLIYVMEAMV